MIIASDGWINIPFAPKYQFNIWTNSVRDIKNKYKTHRVRIPNTDTVGYSFMVDEEIKYFTIPQLREIILGSD